jgi:hypothetical protein
MVVVPYTKLTLSLKQTLEKDERRYCSPSTLATTYSTGRGGQEKGNSLLERADVVASAR